jgi:uncharacterized protein YqgV (UPF0045/DUF77 family)
MRARAEFTIEPFVDGHPGPHVMAALDAVRARGFEPDFGPFGSSIEGAAAEVTDAVADLIAAARWAGAERVSLQIDFLP